MSIPNINIKLRRLTKILEENVHIHQNRKTEPIPMKNFCIILTAFIFVRFSGLSIKKEKKIIPNNKRVVELNRR
jgi:hypothetical protein